MTEQPKIHGVIPVLHMPYCEDEEIDYDTLAKEIDFVFNAGSDGIAIAQASELLRLTHHERLEITGRLSELANKRGTVTMSVGAETAKATAVYAEAAAKAGVDALMAIPPVTTSLPEPELFEYYKTIYDAVDVPVVVQDASGYLGHSLSINLQARLYHELGLRISQSTKTGF